MRYHKVYSASELPLISLFYYFLSFTFLRYGQHSYYASQCGCSAGSFLALIFFISYPIITRLDAEIREKTSSRCLLGATRCSSNRSSLTALIDGVCDEGSTESDDNNYVACLKERFSLGSDCFTFDSSNCLSISYSTI